MYLLFDIGGTNIRLATSLGGNSLLSIKTIPTNLDFNEAISEIEQELVDLLKETGSDFGGLSPMKKRLEYQKMQS